MDHEPWSLRKGSNIRAELCRVWRLFPRSGREDGVGQGIVAEGKWLVCGADCRRAQRTEFKSMPGLDGVSKRG